MKQTSEKKSNAGKKFYSRSIPSYRLAVRREVPALRVCIYLPVAPTLISTRYLRCIAALLELYFVQSCHFDFDMYVPIVLAA